MVNGILQRNSFFFANLEFVPNLNSIKFYLMQTFEQTNIGISSSLSFTFVHLLQYQIRPMNQLKLEKRDLFYF